MSNLKDPDDPEDGRLLGSLLLRKSFRLAEELKVGDKMRFCELLLTVLDDEKKSGSTLELTEVVAK